MRSILVLACALAVGMMAGCGGGGGGTETPLTPTAAVTLPAGVTASNAYTVTYQAASQLPSAPGGSAFVAGAVCSPASTTFTGGQGLLTFTLLTPLEAGATVRLFQADAEGNWTNISSVTVSADRLSLTAPISSFSGNGYAIFKLP